MQADIVNKVPLSETLLDWYDGHARQMPWRVAPADRQAGLRPDPYRVWLSEVMLQQTTVAAVGPYFQAFTERWPSVRDLARAKDADVMAAWAGLGYYARARNLLRCARAVDLEYGGRFPETYEQLIALPGVGPYTASAVGAIAFDLPTTVLDGNVERVMARLYAVQNPLPRAKEELRGLAQSLTPDQRPGDYAQAVMDLGATICTPRNPRCGTCPWAEACEGRKQGIAAQLPAKTPKKPKPTRYGIVFIAQREDGAWLLETRPSKGLLGGMLGWPGTPWHENTDFLNPVPPFQAAWTQVPGEVRHTFTHFHLRLALWYAPAPQASQPDRGDWHDPQAGFHPSALPTVMRKAFDIATSYISSH